MSGRSPVWIWMCFSRADEVKYSSHTLHSCLYVCFCRLSSMCWIVWPCSSFKCKPWLSGIVLSPLYQLVVAISRTKPETADDATHSHLIFSPYSKTDLGFGPLFCTVRLYPANEEFMNDAHGAGSIARLLTSNQVCYYFAMGAPSPLQEPLQLLLLFWGSNTIWR